MRALHFLDPYHELGFKSMGLDQASSGSFVNHTWNPIFK